MRGCQRPELSARPRPRPGRGRFTSAGHRVQNGIGDRAMSRTHPPILDYAPPAPPRSKLRRALGFLLGQLAPRVLRLGLLLMLIVIVAAHMALAALAAVTGRAARWLATVTAAPAT